MPFWITYKTCNCNLDFRKINSVTVRRKQLAYAKYNLTSTGYGSELVQCSCSEVPFPSFSRLAIFEMNRDLSIYLSIYECMYLSRYVCS